MERLKRINASHDIEPDLEDKVGCFRQRKCKCLESEVQLPLNKKRSVS